MDERNFTTGMLLLFGVFLVWPNLATAAPCYDLNKGQPAGLTGALDYVVFAGPPNYENVQKGDTPEPAFVLRLAHPICIQGGKFADPKTSLRAVQLVETAKVQGRLRPLLHRQVRVTLKAPAAAETGHHHAPLFAWVTGIVPAVHQPVVPKARVAVSTTHQMKVAKARGTAPATHQMKFAKEHEPAAVTTHQVAFATDDGTADTTQQAGITEERGSGATAVRVFYGSLANGRGDTASAMVVPQKRAQGPFSADELSRFYGHLQKPLRLENVETNGPGEFLVHYRYAASARGCDGRALVKTVELRGRNYIKSIYALDHC